MRLGIFGGTFNPIHFGHLRAAEEVRYLAGLDKVLFMPSGNPPLKSSDLTDSSHRYAMTRLATRSNPDFLVSDIEMRHEGKSYTVETVEKIYGIYSGDELFFILGLDAFLDIPDWREPERLLTSIDFIIVSRPGLGMRDLSSSPYVEGIDQASETGVLPIRLKGGRRAFAVSVSPFDVSSTSIRRLVREGRSIKYLLPEAVEQYILDTGLYSC